jgi:signal transduction histidine kinase
VLRIRTANRDLAKLVSDLLDVMKAESGRLTVARGGAGLGLAISRCLPGSWGTVSVTSALGAGSAFAVWLPAPAYSETVTLDQDVGAALESLLPER